MYWPGHLFLEFLCTSGRTVIMNHQFHPGVLPDADSIWGITQIRRCRAEVVLPCSHQSVSDPSRHSGMETQTSLWDRGSLDAYVNINATFRSFISTALGVLRTYSSKLKQSTAVTLIRLLASVNKALISSVTLPKSLLQVSFGKLKQNFPPYLL